MTCKVKQKCPPLQKKFSTIYPFPTLPVVMPYRRRRKTRFAGRNRRISFSVQKNGFICVPSAIFPASVHKTGRFCARPEPFSEMYPQNGVLVRTEACFYATYPQNRSNLRTTLSVRASTSRDFRERIILVATPVSTNKSSNDGTVIRVKRKKTHSCYPT